MNTFVLHPDPNMGLFLAPSINLLDEGKMIEWAFVLGDDERSDAYRAWRAEQGADNE